MPGRHLALQSDLKIYSLEYIWPLKIMWSEYMLSSKENWYYFRITVIIVDLEGSQGWLKFGPQEEEWIDCSHMICQWGGWSGLVLLASSEVW